MMESTKDKKYLNWAIIIALLIGSWAAIVYVGAFSKQADVMNSRTYVATGEGKVVTKPDIATFTFSIIDEGGKDIGALKTENDKKSGKIVDFLVSQKIDKADIKTLNYNVSPRYQTCYSTAGRVCPPSEIVGYTISQMYEVKIRDFAKMNDVLSGVVAAGANDVSQISFTVDDMSKLRNEAKAEAIKNAKDQAEMIAKAGGFKLGKIVSVDEGGGMPVPMMYGKNAVLGMGGGADMAASAPSVAQIEPGSQEVVVDVMVRFEIQ